MWLRPKEGAVLIWPAPEAEAELATFHVTRLFIVDQRAFTWRLSASRWAPARV